MISDLLPEHGDNTYLGQKVALWLLGVVLLMRLVMSLNSIFNGRNIVSSADGIPLENYGAEAAQTVVAMFALLGLAMLMMCLAGIVVLARYRSLVPAMFALLLLHSLGGRIVLYVLPIVRTGTPPGFYVNLILLGFMAAGLMLSLWRRQSVGKMGGSERAMHA